MNSLGMRCVRIRLVGNWPEHFEYVAVEFGCRLTIQCIGVPRLQFSQFLVTNTNFGHKILERLPIGKK